MTTVSCVLLLLCVVAVYATPRNTKLKEVFAWKQIDFDFPSEETRQAAIASGEFIPINNLPLGVEIWKDRVFVSVPRRRIGIPATLTYVDANPGTQPTSPKLIPYPDWATNSLPTPSAAANEMHIVSTYRIRIDACDRLWLVDTGLVNTVKYYDPQIMIYDLNTNQLIRKYTLPPDNIKDGTSFANIIVDADAKSCGDAFAYIPDLGSFAVVVYNFKENSSWRVRHHYFYFDILKGNYNVGGVNFQWNDGVFSLALSKRNADGFKTAYFHAMSSSYQFAVSTKILQNRTIASNSYYEYKLVGDKGLNTQASASFLDEKTGVLFYTLINRDGVGCWNSNKQSITPANQGLVSSDNETLIFPCDLKVDRNDVLWVVSNRMPISIYRQINPDQVNYRIFRATVRDAIKGTVCDKSDAIVFQYGRPTGRPHSG